MLCSASPHQAALNQNFADGVHHITCTAPCVCKSHQARQLTGLALGRVLQVKAFNTHQYNRASADVVLPTIKPPAGQTEAWCYGPLVREDNPKVTYVRRTPRLGLRVEAKGDIEFRLENTGKGWTPTYWAAATNEDPLSKNQAKFNPATLPVHARATTASIVVSLAESGWHWRPLCGSYISAKWKRCRVDCSACWGQLVRNRTPHICFVGPIHLILSASHPPTSGGVHNEQHKRPCESRVQDT